MMRQAERCCALYLNFSQLLLNRVSESEICTTILSCPTLPGILRICMDVWARGFIVTTLYQDGSPLDMGEEEQDWFI